jgi:hypothetical protein
VLSVQLKPLMEPHKPSTLGPFAGSGVSSCALRGTRRGVLAAELAEKEMRPTREERVNIMTRREKRSNADCGFKERRSNSVAMESTLECGTAGVQCQSYNLSSPMD